MVLGQLIARLINSNQYGGNKKQYKCWMQMIDQTVDILLYLCMLQDVCFSLIRVVTNIIEIINLHNINLYNQSRQTLQMKCHLILVSMLFSLLCCQINSQFYNNRTRCSHNNFLSNIILNNYLFTLEQFPQTKSYFRIVMPLITQNMIHYGLAIVPDLALSAPCANYIRSNRSCCRKDHYNLLISSLITSYTVFLEPAKHPFVDYLYKIYQQILKQPTCFLNKTMPFLSLPVISNNSSVNYQQFSTNISQSIKSHDILLDKLKSFQKSYMLNSSCLFCLGIDDFKYYLYPRQGMVNNFMLNQQYFNNTITYITNLLLQFDAVNTNISTYIFNKIYLNVNHTSASCSNIMAMILNQTEIQKRRVCSNYTTCRNISIRYFGDVGLMDYSRYFQAINRYNIIGHTTDKVLLDSPSKFYGYQGYVHLNATLADQNQAYGYSDLTPKVKIYPYYNLSGLMNL